MFEKKNKKSGCGCDGEITAEKKTIVQPLRKQVKIEFLYLDLSVCDKCRATETNLEAALSEVYGLLQSAGVNVEIKKIHVQSESQAKELGFVSSPTIRVNGRDLQFETKENYCAPCSQISGTETNCRVWNFQGRDYNAAPKPLIIEGILREVYNGSQREGAEASKITRDFTNIERFFAAKTEA